jgi:hypothetical protein
VDGAGEHEDDADVVEELREVELEGVVAGKHAGGGDAAGGWLEAEQALVHAHLLLLVVRAVRILRQRHAGLGSGIGGEREGNREEEWGEGFPSMDGGLRSERARCMVGRETWSAGHEKKTHHELF